MSVRRYFYGDTQLSLLMIQTWAYLRGRYFSLQLATVGNAKWIQSCCVKKIGEFSLSLAFSCSFIFSKNSFFSDLYKLHMLILTRILKLSQLPTAPTVLLSCCEFPVLLVPPLSIPTLAVNVTLRYQILVDTTDLHLRAF